MIVKMFVVINMVKCLAMKKSIKRLVLANLYLLVHATCDTHWVQLLEEIQVHVA